jgi:imidazole glycerol-phosphate synthase subunit HisH
VITIIDSGMGNIASVLNMIRRIGGEGKLTVRPDEVRTASKLILPGVGAFDAGMAALCGNGMSDAIVSAVNDNGATLLGICLGMQLLMDSSEEGSLAGLGLVTGRVRRLPAESANVRVPHMGWNVVRPVRPSLLFDASGEERRFYFVHSYYAECADPGDVSGVTHYGIDYASAFEHGRVLGVQFHPEKSHRFGMALLKRFVEA